MKGSGFGTGLRDSEGMSEALPFLKRPAGLGAPGTMAGDIGFDPLQITDLVPIQWSREVRSPPAPAAADAADAVAAAGAAAADPALRQRLGARQQGHRRPRDVLPHRLRRRHRGEGLVHVLGARRHHRRPRQALRELRRRHPHLPRLWRRGAERRRQGGHGAARRQAERRGRRHERERRRPRLARRHLCALPRRARLLDGGYARG